MGFLDKIFGGNQEAAPDKVNWKPLEQTTLDVLEQQSFEKPAVIFKHSTRCSISRMALKQFDREFDLDDDQMDLYFLDLLEYRPLSNEIAERFGVQHESPQLLVIKEGKVVYHTSHSGIQADDLKKWV
ncbi:bacillithiol system redox-active protein YtxJ [Flavobacterium cerinum]|uniref:Bacillithiol system redox-active protein YtxJ n=1 Tax=Flavobacterium cerinum TaxID=2502784 RepID=A0ABY5ISC5_9FLAO|nr:bacillithiol system redox-active protein YtxJ [Flavobacterium cerinum]UUC45052.1 bacillithiol system redox-active protein YtxJ [Flavobacterium cerinum]